MARCRGDENTGKDKEEEKSAGLSLRIQPLKRQRVKMEDRGKARVGAKKKKKNYM